jgi:hypothetical protein
MRDQKVSHPDSRKVIQSRAIFQTGRAGPMTSKSPLSGQSVCPARCWGQPECGACVVETKAPEGPYFEVAIIHHTDCGSSLFAD